jgi:hypothetical protein
MLQLVDIRHWFHLWRRISAPLLLLALIAGSRLNPISAAEYTVLDGEILEERENRNHYSYIIHFCSAHGKGFGSERENWEELKRKTRINT